MPGGAGRRLAMAAAIIGFLIVGALAIALFQLVGWLAIALIGLLTLCASVWLDMLGGHALSDIQPGGEAVHLLARQMAERQRASPEQKLALAAEEDSRRRRHYIARTVGIALTAVGIGMFLLHQV